MSTNGGSQNLSLILNARVHPCGGCSRLAVITLEWYSNIIMAPSQLARLSDRQPAPELAVGVEMFTLCMYCLRRERHIPVWDNATKLPRWEQVEVLPGITAEAAGGSS